MECERCGKIIRQSDYYLDLKGDLYNDQVGSISLNDIRVYLCAECYHELEKYLGGEEEDEQEDRLR